jgi:hypothetical protein
MRQTPELWQLLCLHSWARATAQKGFFLMWCHIDTSACHQPGFRTFLDRSEAWPLNIRHTGLMTEASLGALLGLLPRTAVCHLEEMMRFKEVSALETQLLNSGIECPMLQTMKISQVPKMPSLEQATFPNLVALEIEEVNDDKPIGALPRLSTLRIFRVTHVTCSLQSLHSFFSHSPLLESVNLNYVLDDDASEDVDFARLLGSSQVDLPHLSHLEIEETPECTLTLLRILPNPALSLVLNVNALDSSKRTEWDSSA